MTYKIPDINTVMGEVPAQNNVPDQEALIAKGNDLISLLNSFKVSAQISNIFPGPVVTRYELTLDAGTKSSAVENLSTDLAMGLKTKSVRVVPVTEKSVVAIEIPNDKANIVYLRDIFNSDEFVNDPDALNLVLGSDIEGNPVITDLTKAPHMIVAGQTGSGKSVGVNTFLMSLLATKTPEELKLILIDPKVVELTPYNDIPHLITPVITDSIEAIRALDWLTKTMDERYNILAEVGSRNIKDYNEKSETRLPFIVVIIDEMSDLMITSGKKAEKQIVRIAQKARAVGIHLILTTQRPSVAVITGLIKANVPTRIGFQTSSQIDSRIIMDKNGCEELLGKGDMLFQDVSEPNLKRIHGAFVDYKDVDAMVKACSTEAPEYVDFSEDVNVNVPEHDYVSTKLMASVYALLEEGGEPSISYFQRKLKINYVLAKKIIDSLIKTGDIT